MKKVQFMLMAVASVALASCGDKAAQTMSDDNRVEIVKTQVLQAEEISRTLQVSVVLQGYETQNVAPSLTGHIEKIYTEVGTKVKKGDLLVQMDQTQLRSARLAFTNQQTDLMRMQALHEAGNIAQQAFDQTKLAFDQSKENLEYLEANTLVKAPFDGVISARNYENGELYSGQPILVLTQLKLLKALVSVPEKYFPMVKAGMPLTIASDIYPGEQFPATVEVVYPTIDSNTHTFMVKVRIPNADERLRPGMYARTTLQLGKQNVITIPYSALLKLTGSNDRYVFLNENGRAKRVSVIMGERFNDRIEVEAPEIKEGAELVTLGQSRLIDGVSLNVIK